MWATEVAQIVGSPSLWPRRRPPILETVASRSVLIVVFDGFQSLDVSGPLEVFSTANWFVGDGERYEVRTAATRPTVRGTSGLQSTTRRSSGYRSIGRSSPLTEWQRSF